MISSSMIHFKYLVFHAGQKAALQNCFHPCRINFGTRCGQWQLLQTDHMSYIYLYHNSQMQLMSGVSEYICANAFAGGTDNA